MSAVPIAIGIGIIVFAIRSALLQQKGTPIDPNDPQWTAAVNKARAGVGLLRELHSNTSLEPFIKYRFTTSADEKEHVWGRLLGLTENSMRVTLETSPIAHRGELPEELTLPLKALEDWQVELPDGRIRGGFTTQAEIVMAKESGIRIPRHVSAQQGRFVDLL